MTDIWRGTYADIPASVRMVGSTPRAFLADRMVFQEDEIEIFRCALASKQAPDSRPSNMAELARLVAVELRKRGIWAHPRWEDGCISVIGFHGHGAYDRFQVPGMRPYVMTNSDFNNLGPIAIAAEIAQEEAIHAQEWAGDK